MRHDNLNCPTTETDKSLQNVKMSVCDMFSRSTNHNY